ncbi:MAG TPA: hypothetical protein PKA88_31785 [Polyangiaceae bacterium]|nr:hypothetical protein [Polyangiaceae bacterium]HMR74416.1 hypothetical protein [Polyangiaceae bacterium]
MKFRRKFNTFRGGRLVAIGLSAAFLAACGHPVQKKLEGRWVGESVENFDDREMALATGWARGTSFEFSGATVTVAVPAEEPRSGAYKVVQAHNNDVYVAVARPDGKSDRVHFRLDDEHSIRWMLGESRSIVLRREN